MMKLQVELENAGIAGTPGTKDDQTLILEIRDLDEYENGLTGFEQDEYRLYAEDTRTVLKGASDD